MSWLTNALKSYWSSYQPWQYFLVDRRKNQIDKSSRKNCQYPRKNCQCNIIYGILILYISITPYRLRGIVVMTHVYNSICWLRIALTLYQWLSMAIIEFNSKRVQNSVSKGNLLVRDFFCECILYFPDVLRDNLAILERYCNAPIKPWIPTHQDKAFL